jgi:hypothetical protein
LSRYAIYHAYYSNDTYDAVNDFANLYRQKRNLYKHQRSIYNPARRVVEFYPGNLYGGAIDFEAMTGGAIPIMDASDAVLSGLRRLYLDSNMQQIKSLYARHGARYGDVGINIVDDVFRKQVRLEFVHPGKIREVTRDTKGELSQVVLEYVKHDRKQNKDFLFTQVMTLERFFTFRDGKPWAFFENERGEPMDNWPNPYSFIPFEVVHHMNFGEEWGMNSFHDNIRKIDEVNTQASLLNDNVIKHVDAVWLMAGVSGQEEMDADGTYRDDHKMLYGPEGARAQPLVAPLNIDGALRVLQSQLEEIEKGQPELIVGRMNPNAERVTAPGVMSAATEAKNRFNEAMGNYDGGKIRAQRKCLAIGGFRRYEGYESFDLDSWQTDATRHFIQAREIIKPVLTIDKIVEVMERQKVPLQFILTEMGFPKNKVDKIVKAAEKEREKRQEEFQQNIAQGQQGQGEQDNNGQNRPQQLAPQGAGA